MLRNVAPDPLGASFERPVGGDDLLRVVHAIVQWFATHCGVRVLHLKGPIAGAQFADRDRLSSDVDVLVDPAGAQSLVSLMTAHGWQVYFPSSRTAFAHATTLTHPAWGPSVDIHHWFPGIDADPLQAFEGLWGSGVDMDLAGMPCRVPPRSPDHALLLMLHAVRNQEADEAGRDGELVWSGLSAAERHDVSVLAESLGATAALAARHPEVFQASGVRAAYWRIVGSHPSSLTLWAARVMVTPGIRGRLRVVLAAVKPSQVQYQAHRHPGYIQELGRHWARGLRNVPSAGRDIRRAWRGE